MKRFQKLKNIPYFLISAILVLALAAALLWANESKSIQARPAIALKVVFEGQYKIADGAFRPIVKGEKISSTKGDVTLKGNFVLVTAGGEVVGNAQEGVLIALYFNHIGGKVILPGGQTHVFDSENAGLGESACGKSWVIYRCSGAEDDEVTIILSNPHTFGNETAIDEFLGSMSVYSGNHFENNTMNGSRVYRMTGYVLMIVGFALLGIATYTSLLHIRQGKPIWFFGSAVFFGGVFFLMSDPNVSLWSASVAFNTTALGLGFMLYFFSVTTFITYFTEEKWGIAAKITAGISAAVTAVILFIALCGGAFFYDLWLIWCVLQSAVVLAMLGFTVFGIKGDAKKRLFVQVPCVLVLPAFLIDMAAIAFGWWKSCAASEIAFGVMFLSLLVLTLRVLPHNIRAAMREKELLAERKELQAELKQSRFSVMLSQIQPHFLYNTLNAIYHLCGKDPQTAQEAISSFADYLRSNLDSLDYKELITFDQELQHIKTYLDLEKIRFGDELEVLYDIKTSAFSLPIMSVQPLVENAVKHGVSKHRDGGSVTVATAETDDAYVVTVRDTGVGFDVEHYADDGKKHIGIENSRQRLQAMCDATLAITSEKGKGTTVTITLPKKGGAL